MAEHDRARTLGLRGKALQAAGAADAVGGELADLLARSRRRRGDRVVVVRLDPHHARGLGGAEADREDGAERDRHLAEDVARVALADDALDAVDEPHRLDAAVEHREERPLVALVSRELARAEADVGRGAADALALGRARDIAKTAIRPISSGVTIPVCPAPRSNATGTGATAGSQPASLVSALSRAAFIDR